MSGALSSLGLGAIAGATLGDLGGASGIVGTVLADILSTAAFRGVTFYMPNVSEQVGRRLVRWLFPGRDGQKFQDFGSLEGEIRVTGLIIGDDYVIRAQRLRTALLTSGPGILVHPWWGRIRVRLAQPAEISFAEGEIRLARFTASFFRDPAETGARGLFERIDDTLTNVLTQADALVDQGILACQSVLSPIAIPLALSSGVASYLSQASGVWDALVESSAQPVQAAATAAQMSLAAGVTVPVSNADTTYADAVSAALASVPAAIASSAAPSSTAAIAPATQVVDGVTLAADPASVVSILLSGALQLGDAALMLSDISQEPAAVLGLGVVARMMALTQAVAASASVSYISQPDAMTARDTLIDAIDALGVDIENASASGATFAMSALWASLRDLRTAVIADYSDRVGRLPAVLTLAVPAQVSAWTIAYAVAGDTPGDVQAVMEDMVTRNDLVHPALAGPGTLDVLDLDT